MLREKFGFYNYDKVGLYEAYWIVTIIWLLIFHTLSHLKIIRLTTKLI